MTGFMMTGANNLEVGRDQTQEYLYLPSWVQPPELREVHLAFHSSNRAQGLHVRISLIQVCSMQTLLPISTSISTSICMSMSTSKG